jgi:hypothetical protein
MEKTPRLHKSFGIIATLILAACQVSSQTPEPTNPLSTATSVNTEIPQTNYQADVADVTTLMENPTTAISLKDTYDASFSLAKEMPEFSNSTPRIWTLSVNDNGPKVDESLIIAQNETTNESYILDINTSSSTETKTTLIQEKIFAEVVMGESGQYQKIRYYYNENDGSQTEFLRYDPENNINNSNYVYTMIDGNEVALDGIGIYFGKTEDTQTGGKLLSLVPLGEDFYRSLPEGSVIEMEENNILSLGIQINGEYFPAGKIDIEENKFRIVTAKNEPYKVDLDRLVVQNRTLVILGDNSQKLLEFGDGGWEADKLLFLLAPKPYSGFPYSKDLLPTGFGVREMTSVLVNIEENGSVNVGFYENSGFLHTYELGLGNQANVVGICETTAANGDQMCKIYSPDEALVILTNWYEKEMPRLLSFDLLSYTDPTTKQILNALKAGEGFPTAPEGYKIPANTIRER